MQADAEEDALRTREEDAGGAFKQVAQSGSPLPAGNAGETAAGEKAAGETGLDDGAADAEDAEAEKSRRVWQETRNALQTTHARYGEAAQTLERSTGTAPAAEETKDPTIANLEKEFELAEDTARQLSKKAEEGRGTIKSRDDSFPIRYKEALNQLEVRCGPTPEALAQLEQEEGFEPVSIGLFACLKKPKSGNARTIPYLQPQFAPASDVVLCWSKVKYDPAGNTLHLRMLRTVYKKITGSKVDIPWCCAQWEVLGFQGSDPRTDLNRTFGILNVLHLLYFISEHADLVKQVYLYARQKNDSINENFPFAPTSVNMTKVAMDAFRAGALSALINQKSDAGAVHAVIAEVYVAAYFNLYWEFRKKKLDIHSFGKIFKETSNLAMKKPAELLKRFAKNKEAKLEGLKTVELDHIEEFGGRAASAPKSAKEQRAAQREAEQMNRRLAAYAS